MKPNEITQRDIDKWTRCSPSSQLCRPADAAMSQGCGGIDQSEALQLFDTMAARARLADLGQQSSALAHELRQPLFSIAIANENLRMMLALGNMMQPQLTKAVERIAEQVQRAQTIIDHTLAYAAGKTGGMVSADLGLAARNALRFLQPLFDASGIEIDERNAHVRAEVGLCQIEVEQVFVNILRNAAESIEARREAGWQGTGRIALHIAVESGKVHCTVADNGAGLSKDLGQSAFQPFFTTKPRVGTGLGLHICRQVLGRIGGAVELVPGDTDGARVEIVLPLVESD
ncbi:sensor histidine kinase [Novosphingobium resinovorum]|uniref:sensor histidine kinase n=1 Tax=Novosphingobium resinovorum TaxID=158500 RepID=UPI002ED106D4|nr:ATP-binding protein [Novosphingobium resinovorum]